MPEVWVACEAVLDRVERAVVGKREPLTLLFAAILAGGHVLVEDFPGLGKTLAARSFAQTLGLPFRRLQFTPDLLPADVTGSFVYDQRRSEFVFRAGPLFTGLLLADEINRTPPKTQAALLEAMQERQVTVEGRTFELPAPFHVIATANPIEYEGTYPLPEAQLDRFLLRVSFGYPGRMHELDVLRRRIARRQEAITLDPVLDPGHLLRVQRTVEDVTVEETVAGYCVDLAVATRTRGQVLVGASPRGALALLLVARAYAVLRGRDFVTPEDVKAVAVPALAHRITLRPEMWMRRVAPADVVRAVLDEVPAPPTIGPGGGRPFGQPFPGQPGPPAGPPPGPGGPPRWSGSSAPAAPPAGRSDAPGWPGGPPGAAPGQPAGGPQPRGAGH
jgi:MoxR-like ATPase